MKTVFTFVLTLSILVCSNELIEGANFDAAFCSVDWTRHCDDVPLSNPCEGICGAGDLGVICGADAVLNHDQYATVKPPPPPGNGRWSVSIKTKKVCGALKNCKCVFINIGVLGCRVNSIEEGLPWLQSQAVAAGDICID